eukprot:Sspe_Gene.105848::Locus_82965_Transcript_2_2_Confidence_0.667_Length_912::g.105848::m.105848/K06268/PPP3R, CNB; serine/threonine-protein phosphatase 2B regulatory subunit
MGCCSSAEHSSPPPKRSGTKRHAYEVSTITNYDASTNEVLCGLSLEQRCELAKTTHFTLNEIDALCKRYGTISACRDDDGVIDRGEWGDAFHGTKEEAIEDAFIIPDHQPTLFVERMFRIFDRDGNGEIDLEEFIRGLSVFSDRGTPEEKMRFAFRVYDINNDGVISRDELHAVLKSSVAEANSKNHSSSVSISQETMDSLVDQTFKEADVNGDDQIDLEEFCTMVKRHPDIIANINFRSRLTDLVR